MRRFAAFCPPVLLYSPEKTFDFIRLSHVVSLKHKMQSQIHVLFQFGLESMYKDQACCRYISKRLFLDNKDISMSIWLKVQKQGKRAHFHQ